MTSCILTFNGVTTSAPGVSDCKLVQALSGTFAVNNQVTIECDLFTREQVKAFLDFRSSWNLMPQDIRSAHVLHTHLDIANYLGCDRHTYGAIVMAACYIPLETWDCLIVLEMCRLAKKVPPKYMTTNLSRLSNLRAGEVEKLRATSAASDDELMLYANDDAMFPITIPKNHKVSFDTELNKWRAVLDCVDAVPGCFVVGGFLVDCMREYIKPAATANNLSVSNIDISCPSDVFGILAGLLCSKLDVCVFLHNTVAVLFVRHSPVQIRLVGGVRDRVDLPCAALTYREGVLMGPVAFHKAMSSGWVINLEPRWLYCQHRIDKYTEKGFVLRGYTPQKEITAYIPHWYKWTDEDPAALTAIVRMIYGPMYQYVRESSVKHMKCYQSWDPSVRSGFYTQLASPVVGEEHDTIILRHFKHVPDSLGCAIRIPTYTYETSATDVVDGAFTCDRAFFETLNFIGESMLKQSEVQCKWVTHPVIIKASKGIYEHSGNVLYTFSARLFTSCSGHKYLRMSATATKGRY